MLKEKLCYVAYDIEQEQRLATETTFLVESFTVCGGASETRMQGDKVVRKAGSVTETRRDMLGEVVKKCKLKILNNSDHHETRKHQ